jgi:hypothetical protein
VGDPKIPPRVLTAYQFLRLINEYEMGTHVYDSAMPAKNQLSKEEIAAKQSAIYVINSYLRGEHEHDAPKPPKIKIFIQPPPNTTLKQFLDGLKAGGEEDDE